MEIPSVFQTKQQHRSDGEELLIFPGPHVYNHRWKDYRVRWLRSMHIDARTSAIISCGFPKFMALGTGSDQYNVSLADVLKAKDLVATEKIDGTCLIRYVFDGKIHWRTKQSFYVQLENEFEIREFETRYPKLLDPEFCANVTLLFEWVSPFNQIIVKYDEPSITIIGAVTYRRDIPWYDAEPHMLELHPLQAISGICGVPLVEHFTLKSKDEIHGLLERTKSSNYEEGYVLRLNHDQELVKVKSDWWLLAFACKITFTSPLAVELWLHWGMPDWSDYSNLFAETFDGEAWEKGMPVVSAMYDGIKTTNKIIRHLEEFCHTNAKLDDEEFDKIASDRFNMLRLDACRLMRRNRPVSDEIWKKLILQSSAQMEKTIDTSV